MKKNRHFDVVIVGGGVGGMTTAVYAKRRGLSVAIVEKFALGGTVLTLGKIHNFPSQADIDGQGLAELFAKQTKAQEVEIIRDEVVSSNLLGAEKILVGKKGTYTSRSVVIATGLSYRTLGIGEEDFIGRGVSFCATCDANFFRGKNVVLASKNGSALRSARVLGEVCSKVTICDEGKIDALPANLQNEKIELRNGSKVTKIGGNGAVEFVEIETNGKAQKLHASALFVDLGKRVDLSAFSGLETDKGGFIVTDENMQTSVQGVFAVGDVRAKNLRQIVTACSDGAIAGTRV